MKRCVSTMTMSFFISTMRRAADSCSWRCLSTGNLRISSRSLTPSFCASSNIRVPYVTTVALCFDINSAARVMTVVLPTPGIPTIIARLFPAKEGRQFGHVRVYLLFDKRLVVAHHDVDHEEQACSRSKDAKHVRQRRE